MSSRYKPGQCGNPQGRPKGALGDRQKFFNDFIKPRRDDLLQKAYDLAIGGNESMLRLLLDRLIPARPTDDPINVEMPAIDSKKIDTLLQYGERVLKAISDNDITPDQGKSLMAVIESQRKNIEIASLSLRIDDIEKRLNNE
jgi:uncharacterized protein DUF5681